MPATASRGAPSAPPNFASPQRGSTRWTGTDCRALNGVEIAVINKAMSSDTFRTAAHSKQFGEPLARNQLIQKKLADGLTEVPCRT